MRGEYKTAVDAPSSTTELPPRARRIPGTAHRARSGHGTTSACAENTEGFEGILAAVRNYLRVRGEYRFPRSNPADSPELPPRARRIRCRGWGLVCRPGTTSACAENTLDRPPVIHRPRNYLRVRGEYTLGVHEIQDRQELPPRARRILLPPFIPGG